MTAAAAASARRVARHAADTGSRYLSGCIVLAALAVTALDACGLLA